MSLLQEEIFEALSTKDSRLFLFALQLELEAFLLRSSPYALLLLIACLLAFSFRAFLSLFFLF